MKSAGRSELVIRCTIYFSTIGLVSFARTGYKSAKQLSLEAECNGLVSAIKEQELLCCYCLVVGIIFAHKPLLSMTTSCAKFPN